jgi:hypothetical protein
MALVEVPAGAQTQRYFVTYTGIGLPLKLVQEIEPAQTANRNTFIRAWYDENDRMAGLEKLVYGDIELSHRYSYDEKGQLERAEIKLIGEPLSILIFEDEALVDEIQNEDEAETADE